MINFLYNEWKRKSKELTDRLQEYNEEYRKKYAYGKTTEQLEREGWRLVNGKLYCNRMHKARVQKYKKEIDEIVRFTFSLHLAECSEEPNKALQDHLEQPPGTVFVQRIFRNS